jgi:hypothetical protein
MFAVALWAALQIAPPVPPVALSDLQNFPEPWMTYKAVAAAREQYEYCRQQRRMNLSPNLPWRQWEEEAGRTVVCWENLVDAHQSYFWLGDSGRLQALGEIRRMVGPTAYACGWMPSPVYTHTVTLREDCPDKPTTDPELD